MTFTPHPALHPVFEILGYIVAYLVYRRLGRAGDPLGGERRWMILAAAAIGALCGSRVLGILEQAPRTGFHWHAFFEPGGKTIVGGLLGGWLGVELAKAMTGIHSRTGDLFAAPLCAGIAVGRIGCFAAGLPDDTYGTPTSLPWGVDFGDGIRRHPTQLYELVFLVLLAGFLLARSRKPHREGAIFRMFLAAYLTWRLLIDFIKPQPLVHGLNLIQWSCVAGLAMLVASELWPSRSSTPAKIVAGRDPV
jgi:prolipoprotein diacylglyceryltransferase